MLIKNKNSFVVFFVSLLFGLVLLNLTSRDIFHRFDLTDNKMFSLSNSSESILEKVDDRLTIKVYFSDNLPNELGNTRRYLQDILEEYRAVSKNINFYFYDPESDSELEEQARKDGIQPVQMQSLENDQMVVKKVYLGMVLLYEDKKETLPVIQTTAGLEYMISTKLKALINADKITNRIREVKISKTNLVKLSNCERRTAWNVQYGLPREDFIEYESESVATKFHQFSQEILVNNEKFSEKENIESFIQLTNEEDEVSGDQVYL